MTTHGANALGAQLLQSLSDIDFDRRFYDYYETISSRVSTPMPSLDRHSIETAMGGVDLDFRYSSREEFFHHRERHPHFEICLNIDFAFSMADFGLYLSTDENSAGDVYCMLAMNVARLRRPGFEYSPYAPKLPFSNPEQLEEVIRFGAGLFVETRSRISASMSSEARPDK